MEPTEDEIRDWREQVRLNTLVHEYAREKLRSPAFGPDGGDELNEKVKSHYVRLAEDSRELSELFRRVLEERETITECADGGSASSPSEQLP